MTEQTQNEVIDEPAHDAVVVSNIPGKFDVTSAAIKEMQDQTESMSITGPDDKEGYTAMSTFRKVVKKQRIAIEKRAEELKAPHKDYLKKVDEVADSLIEPMKAIENTLAIQEKQHLDEKERLAHERAMFLQNRMEERVNQLRAWGFIWNGTNDTYVFDRKEEIGYELVINFDDIRELSDEDYAPTVELALQAHTSDQERIKERNRLAEEERIRKENEAKAEADRLAKIAADQQAEAERLAAAAKQLEEAEERARQIELKALLVIRTPKLTALGFVEEETGFVSPFTYLRKEQIVKFSDEAFDEFIIKLTQQVDEFNKAQRWETLRLQMIRVGFVDCGAYMEHLDFKIDKVDACALSDTAFEKLLAEAPKRVKQKETEQKNADKARQTRLKPDRKPLRIYFETAGELVHPPITQPESEALIVEFTEELTQLVNRYLDRIDTL